MEGSAAEAEEVVLEGSQVSAEATAITVGSKGTSRENALTIQQLDNFHGDLKKE